VRVPSFAFLVLLAAGQDPEPLRIDAELRAGLLAVYRSLDADLPLTRIDSKPGFTWGASSPHPRIAPGPFEAVWTGVFLQPESDTLRFGAYVGGSVKVALGGVVVLEGRGDRETSWIQGTDRVWKPGAHRFRVEYRSLPDVPARLQLWWEGKLFSREPLPGWRLKHLATELPEAARQEEEISRGREAAVRWGCVQCHRSAFPSLPESPPGPSLEGLGTRVGQSWLLRFLENPKGVRHDARMPSLFTPDRKGFVERWLLAQHLVGNEKPPPAAGATGDVRKGRASFALLGCATCHVVPDMDRAAQPEPGLLPFEGLADRMTPASLSAFLQNPLARYPDGRKPRIPVDRPTADDIVAYLLKESPPAAAGSAESAPSPKEIDEVRRRLGVADPAAAGEALLREKNCLPCHTSKPLDLPLRKVEGGCRGARFEMPQDAQRAIGAYLKVASLERHPSPFEARRQLLSKHECFRCHQRDGDRPALIEATGARVGTEVRQHRLPFQRTPRLTNALSKYRRSYLVSAIRDGVSGVRPDWYSYRMPAYGAEAEQIVQALAEGDGDLATQPDTPPAPVADPVAHVDGPILVGFEGYSCITCHLWKRENITNPDPGAVGPELTTVTGRIRREWFNRWLEDPTRVHPGTPMPAVFQKGQPAKLHTAFGNDADKQKEAIWDYLSKGKDAVSPKSPPPTPVPPPAAGGPPLIAQIPIGSVAEALCVLTGSHDVLLYDVGSATLLNVYTGAQILRKSRPRGFTVAGTPAAAAGIDANPSFELVTAGRREAPSSFRFHGYDRLPDGVRLRTRLRFPSASVELTETLRLGRDRSLRREIALKDVPAGSTVELRTRREFAKEPSVIPVAAEGTVAYEIPPPRSPPKPEAAMSVAAGRLADTASIEGSLERPGYRAIAYPRPMTALGEDAVMPYAIAVNPRDGTVFVSSEKMGDVLVLRDPHDNGKDARFDDYARGLFHQAYGTLHDGESLYVLHRRNLTRVRDTDGDGAADAFERVVGGAEWNGDSRAFGLVRDKKGAFWMNLGDTKKAWPGSAAALRLVPGDPPTFEDAAFGLRQVYGWCFDQEDRLFFTDNQGEWVATNKLCLLEPGRFYGYRNPEKKRHFTEPAGKAAVWIPYGWAKSVNGLDLDRSGGRFGPFAGQFFMAELMYGGGLIRANVEKVNGEVQGACFPFWGKGLLGPLVLAFDPKGRLYVGSLTEAECGAQPDRGALFRIDFTGETPFEIQTIHVRPQGFRLTLTRPADPATAREAASFAVEHYRYEYTGAYGSPELDRTHVAVHGVHVSEGGRVVDLETAPLVKDRVYLIQARGVRSAKGESLVHPIGAYTLHEIPLR